MSEVPASLVLRRYQVRPAGLVGATTPTVAEPSPSQSPTTGRQPAPPDWETPAGGGPALLAPRRNQVAVYGSKAPTVVGTVRSSSCSTCGRFRQRAWRVSRRECDLIRILVSARVVRSTCERGGGPGPPHGGLQGKVR